MASDPAIRAALARAVNGYDAARVASHNGSLERDGMSPANKAHITPLLAAAIAAFLRALPARVRLEPGVVPLGWLATELAAAVEAAAKEPGHD